MTAEDHAIADAADQFRRGVLPAPGGFLDQPAYLVDCFAIVEDTRRRLAPDVEEVSEHG